MSTRQMPGFTAAAALYPTAGRYRSVGASARRSGSGAIEPQLPIGFCMAECDFKNPDDPFMATVCKFGCFDTQPGQGGGGGAGGGGGSTARACAQCKSACNRKPLSQRAACKANCDDTVC